MLKHINVYMHCTAIFLFLKNLRTYHNAGLIDELMKMYLLKLLIPWLKMGWQIGLRIPFLTINASNLRQTIFKLMDLLSCSANPLI